MRNVCMLLVVFLLVSCQSRYEGLTQNIDKAMQGFIKEKKISGAVTLAYHKGEVIHYSAVGQADISKDKPMAKDSLFRIASLTKNFAAVAVLILQDEGKLNVNDRVSQYIPAFKNTKVKGKNKTADLRIWHLMSHMSGIGMPKQYSLYGMPSLEKAANEAAKIPLKFEPGREWKYSRGLDICGRIVEVVSGKSFEQFLTDKIYKPLGMKDTGFTLNAEQAKRLVITYEPGKDKKSIIPSTKPYLATAPPASTKPLPSGGLISSTKDIGCFYTMLLNKGVYNGQRIISEKGIKQLTTSVTKDKKAGFIPGSAWGLGFGLVKDPQGVSAMLNPGTFGHGGAFGTQAWVDPISETIYVLMIQRTKFGNSDGSDIRKKFQQIVADFL